MDNLCLQQLQILFKIQQECNPTAALIYNWMLIRMSLETRRKLEGATYCTIEGATYCKDVKSNVGFVEMFNGTPWLKVSIKELSEITNKSERMVKYAVDNLCISGFLFKKKQLKRDYEQNYYYSLVKFSETPTLKPAENSKVQFIAPSKVQKVAPSLYITNFKDIDKKSSSISSYSTISEEEHYNLLDRQAKAPKMTTTTTSIKKNQVKDWSGPEDDMARVWNEILGWKKPISVAFPGNQALLKSARINHFPNIEDWRAYCQLIRSSSKLTGFGWGLSLQWACSSQRIQEIKSGEWGVQLPGVAEAVAQQKALNREYPSSHGYSDLPEGHPDGMIARLARKNLEESKAQYAKRLAEEGLPFIEPEQLEEMQAAVSGGFDPNKPWAEQLGLNKNNEKEG